MPLLSTIGAAAARAFGFLRSLISGYNVANSARFVTGDSLTRTVTPSSSTSYTVSFWLKLSDVTYSSTPYLWSVGSSAGGNGIYLFDSDRKIYFFDRPSGFLSLYDGVLRDPSAWYHVVWSVNSGTGTGYINGITGNTHSSIPALNDNTGNKISIHDYVDNTLGLTFVGCYMSEFNFIDGQALTPSSFGQTNSATGIWTPKAYTGSFGTNGFYLKFGNSAALGTDSSGNGNNFTVNNLTSVDQSTDTPTNNFATFNSIKFSGGTLTQGNLELDSASGSWKTRNSTIGVSAGKWFMEFKMGAITDDQSGVAIMPDTVTDGNFPASDATRSPGIAYNSDGRKWVNGSLTAAYFSTMSTDDIIGIALDMTGGTVQFYRNGSTTGSPINLSDAFTSSNYPLFFVAAVYGTRDVQANFGSPSFTISSGNADANGYGNFEYAVPSGYYALCTKNLAQYG